MLYERQERSQLRKYKDFNENLKRKALMLNWFKLFYTQKIYTSNWACNLWTPVSFGFGRSQAINCKKLCNMN